MNNKYMKQLGLALFLGAISLPAAAAGEVQLQYARSHGCTPSPSCFETAEAVLEVQNLGGAKSVGVRYRTRGGVWADGAAFVTRWPTAAGKELWYAALPGGIDSFAVYYTVNGTTYWDNNGGRNYTLAVGQDDAVLGRPAIANPLGMRSRFPTDRVDGEVWVKNLSYTKTVKVVYTDSSWASTKEAKAYYKRTYPSGVEAWAFSAPLAAGTLAPQIQMAFYYSWIGGSAWDNNGGRNYVINSQNVIGRIQQ